MPTLNEKMQLGTALFSQPHDIGERRVYGTATAASSDGSVSVDVGGEIVTIPTVGAVAQGDEVVIQVQNGHPVAIGVRGWGDAIQSQVDETASYVWLDQYGHLRVTPLPKEQSPTTGVTIDANSVDIISDDYTSSLTDGGLTVIDNNAGNIVRMATASVDPWYTYPTVMGAGGLHLAATNNDFDSQSRMFDALTIFAAPPASGQFANTVAYFNWGGSLPVLQVKTDCIALPDDNDVMQDVYATATSTRLGAVKVGDGLSVSGAGLLSANVGAWRSVSVVSSYLPSAFNIRDVRVYANDHLRLLYFYAHFENSSGTNVNAGSNAVFFSCTDTSLYPSATKEVCNGFRYSSSGLLDFPVNMYQWNQSLHTWGFRGPSWAFSASSIKFSGVIPYDSVGIA